jgi:hypothetical protein
MARHLRKCKWCEFGSFSYKWGEWNCWHNEKPLTDAEAKRGCDNFKPNEFCPEGVLRELGFKKEDVISLFYLLQ